MPEMLPKEALSVELASAYSRTVAVWEDKTAEHEEERHATFPSEIKGRMGKRFHAVAQIYKKNKQETRRLKRANPVRIVLS